jgi:mannose-1-phosphate guanylyltransferase
MLHAVIMAGGSGTRFWPLSRQARPKQCLALGTPEPLIVETSKRLTPLIDFENQLIVAGRKLETPLKDLFKEWDTSQFIWEPCARNTAPCIGLAALLLAAQDPDAILVVLPSDHHIAQPADFRAAIEAAQQRAALGELVTLGIRPTRAETGYGYIELDQMLDKHNDHLAVQKFVEKPNQQLAQTYLDGGKHLWNSGMFIFQAKRMLSDLCKYQPVLYAGLKALEPHIGQKTFSAELEYIFPRLPSISIDYGVLEPCSNDPDGEPISVIPSNFGWNDVGSWEALSDYNQADEEGNVKSGRVLSIDTTNSIIQSHGPAISVIGLESLVIVSTDDAILVCPRDAVQRVKEIPALADKLKWGDLC